MGWSEKLTDCFSSTASASSATSLDAILLQVRPIRMARSWEQVHLVALVVMRPLVLVHDAKSNRRAQRDAELGAGLDLDPVLFISRGGYGALTRTTARELGLDVFLREAEAGRAAIDDGYDGATVGFAGSEELQVSDLRTIGIGGWELGGRRTW